MQRKKSEKKPARAFIISPITRETGQRFELSNEASGWIYPLVVFLALIIGLAVLVR